MRQVRGGRTPGGGWDLSAAEVSEVMEASFSSTDATPERPLYTKVEEDTDVAGTVLYMIVCDEGWRSSIVCEGMYEWTADWLIEVLGRRPFALDRSHRDQAGASAEAGPGAGEQARGTSSDVHPGRGGPSR